MTRTALVTGGNRGIGFETCRQLARAGLQVVLTARDERLGREAAERLASQELAVSFERLDVSSEQSVRACAERLRARDAHVDVLVNNAAICPRVGFFEEADETVREVFAVNFLGAVWTCRAFVPAMVKGGYGRVVNVTSGYGSIAEGLEGPAAYSLSKAALNALTLKLAAEVGGDVKVNALDPGWVRTRMGGPAAPTSPEEAAEPIVWLATLPKDGPTGQCFRRRRPVPW
jgi:NAD(P)-dependent dehydrogenase (short-subunit alcohol dehydrogenase family)